MANTNPIFIGTPRITAAVTSATSPRDGSSGLTQLFVADSSNGSRVEKINCFAAGTQSAASSNMSVRIYVADAAGNNPRIIREQLLAATTPSATVLGAFATFQFPGGLLMGTNSSIYVGQSTFASSADTLHWTAEGGNF